MLDKLYDDVLSVMTEKGFTDWFEHNRSSKTSPLKWSYNNDCELSPHKPPSGLTWLGYSYETHQYSPYTIMIEP